MTNSHCHHLHGKALYSTLFIAFGFMFVEVVAGWIANSLALLSDALHLFTDVGALALSLVVLKIAHRPASPGMSYGYQRAEILGALASALSLWILAGVLIYEAIIHLIHPEPVQGSIVFIIASVGLIANLLMMKQLHKSQTDNINIRAAYLHIIGDLLASIGVIIGGGLLWITGFNPIDPIVTLVFSSVILFSSSKIISESILILMESTPLGIDPLKIKQDLLSIAGVQEVHDLHVWAVSYKKTALSAHLVADDSQKILNEAHRLIESKYHISHMTIQVEDLKHFESKYCYDCDNGPLA